MKLPLLLSVAASMLTICESTWSNKRVRVGQFEQEVALHRDRQGGLPSPTILSVFLGEGDKITVQTLRGFANWNGTSWEECVRFKTKQPELPGDISKAKIAAHQKSDHWAAASPQGLFEKVNQQPWKKLKVADGLGRVWADSDVRAATYDARGQLWFATLAGVGCRDEEGKWQFFEGKDGLPYNDFTCAASGTDGSVWFGTSRGAIRFRHGTWSYRQGLRWLPGDQIRGIVVDKDSTAWFATPSGIGCIANRKMTLAKKAAYYEDEIDRFNKRTPFGYVGNAQLAKPGDKSHVTNHDSDNDGLWTAMYGASQCFAYAITKSESSKRRATGAFEALRFLQVVTEGGPHSPPMGYVARTILPAGGPDPNQGRLENDKRFQQTRDRLWKTYEPRWPKSADGKWYWKSDTSSDELDGHFFFYPLYYDLVAETQDEKAKVREVVRKLIDHLIKHDFVLQDHDGKPTRWAMFRPSTLNHDIDWSHERGLNSLSMLSYLTVAHHMTGDNRYREVFQKLDRQHHYVANAMVPKIQRGIGSGNQSDDEMAFMDLYNLVKYTKDNNLRLRFLSVFYSYWMLEQPERNPFFHFAYAAFGRGKETRDPFGQTELSPWGDWLQDSIDTLKGFPLDRMNWAHANSHRLDLVALPKQQASDVLGTNRIDRERINRGYRVDGKVLPVEERFFTHWNTDAWRIDYGGDGRTLACGSVFLLPYYMGLYHELFE